MPYHATLTCAPVPACASACQGVIGPGGVQWMTAGRGIIHSEMPKVTDGILWGFQLWINLPKKDKMCKPRCVGRVASLGVALDEWPLGCRRMTGLAEGTLSAARFEDKRGGGGVSTPVEERAECFVEPRSDVTLQCVVAASYCWPHSSSTGHHHKAPSLPCLPVPHPTLSFPQVPGLPEG